MKHRTKISAVLLAVFGLAFSVMAAPGDLLRTFPNPALTADDGFGYSVSAVGNNVLGGAPSVDIPGAPGDDRFAGRAYLLDGSTGSLLHTFQGDGGGMFGFLTAVVDSNILISAFHDNTNAVSTGAVYLFDGLTGSELSQSPILNPTPQNYDEFGYSVAVAGNNIVIGAPGDSTTANSAGAAYLFNGSTGNLLRTFQKPTPVIYDNFGYSVAVLGNNVLVGSPGDDTGATNAGAVYLLDSSTGNVLRTFLNPTPANYDNFGFCIAVLGSNVLIGAKGDNTGATSAGAAYLFDGSNGVLLRTFLNPTPENYDEFASSVATVGHNILIGAPKDNTGANSTGAVYLFDGLTGNLLLTFTNPTPEDSDWFGYSVAAMGNNILIGASGDDSNGNAGGAVYLFEGFPWAGDFEPDGDVDANDLAVFTEQWLRPKLSMDAAPGGGDGTVNFLDWAVFADGWQDTADIYDLADFVDQWLQPSAYCADIAPAPDGDGTVNMLDFAEFAGNWWKGVP